MEKEELAALRYLFGSQPVTGTYYLRDAHDDKTAGVPFVLRALSAAENMAVLAEVGSKASQEEKGGLWMRAPLAYSLVSIGGLQMPPDVERRREVIAAWPYPVLFQLASAYEEFAEGLIAAQQYMDERALRDPFPSGAENGPPSAPREHGGGRASTVSR